MDQRSDRRVGFTLVELLVVIAIIGVLVGLLLPAVQAAREAARRLSCSNNLKQIGLAFHNYESTFKSFPAAYYVHPPAPPYNLQGPSVGLLPFMEQQALYSQYSPSFSATYEGGPVSVANVAVISTPLSAFVCPSVPGGLDRVYDGQAPAGSMPGLPSLTWKAAPSDYTVTGGIRGVFADAAYANHGGAGGDRHGALREVVIDDENSSKIASITDGTSHTFLMGERTGGNKFYSGMREMVVPAPYNGLQGGGWGDMLNGDNWLAGTVRNPTFPAPEGPCAINCTNLRGHSFHSFHPGGCHFLMADGAIRFVGETIEAYALAAQITREKGEVTPTAP